MSASHDLSALSVAVIGGGPVGLAAAAHLITRGVPVKLYEAGESVASHVRSWGHVRLFSPWKFNTDQAATYILRQYGWQEPSAEALPTGSDLYDAYLQPLSETPELVAVIETGARVNAISRRGMDKVVSRGRIDEPFALTIESGDRRARIDLARAVIDASGTWANPNPMGAAGVPALGETGVGERVAYGIPDILGADRVSYAGQRVLVIGGGHSAANALLDLMRLAERNAHTHVTWALRSASPARVFGGGANDELSARGKLGTDLERLIKDHRLTLVTNFHAERVEEDAMGVVVTGTGSAGVAILGPFDRVIVSTGQRPDLALTRELRLELDPWLESPRALGPLIDPNVHSCGTVYPHGYKELAHPEPGYFAVGIKSYGRAPTFLMATGYEQVRSVTAFLAGDLEAANDVRLVLPETGVCSTNLAAASAETGCCGGPAPAEADACCVDDAQAKAAGKSGCGCGPSSKAEAPKQAAACCSAL